MKKTNVDLIVGGSIITALFILIAGVLWLKEVSLSRKQVSYTVLFPEVGTLQVGDPISANGVQCGNVKSISLRGSQVAVVIEIDKKLVLTDSSKVTVQNIGLMGERGIGIAPSAKGIQLKPSSNNDTTFIAGYFDTGIAEVMGMLGSILGEVQILTKNVNSVIDKTVGDSTFLTIFDRLVVRLDSISNLTEGILDKNKPLIDNTFKNINIVSSDLKTLLDKNSGHIDTIMKNGAELSSYAVTVVNRVDTLALSVQQMVKQIDSGKGSIGMLMKDEQFYKDLKKTVADIDTLINEVQYDALKLRIKLGFGKKKKKE